MGSEITTTVTSSRKYSKCRKKGCANGLSEIHFFCEKHARDEFVNYCYLCDTRNVTFDIPPRHYSWTDGVRGSNSARWGAELRVVGGKVCDNCDGEMKHAMEKSQQSFRQSNLERFDYVEGIALISVALIWVISLLVAIFFFGDFLVFLVIFISGYVLYTYETRGFEKQLEERNRVFHVAWTKHEVEKHKIGTYLSPNVRNAWMERDNFFSLPLSIRRDTPASKLLEERFKNDQNRKINMYAHQARKEEWIKLCTIYGIRHEKNTITELKSKISAWNKLVDLQRGKTKLTKEEQMHFVNALSDFVLMSKKDLLQEVQQKFPDENTKYKSVIDLLKLLDTS